MTYDDVINALHDFWADADARQASDCPNGPDEYGNFPCDPKGYFGVLECQVCGRIGSAAPAGPKGEPDATR